MRAVLTRVKSASVTIDGEIAGAIGKGFLILLGVHEDDTEAEARKIADKICGLRIFEDENGKMNLSCADVGGEMLVISNFTLYADCRRGTRPDFFHAMRPDEADRLYEKFIDRLSERYTVRHGEFGADMKVSLINDGPVTIVIDTDDLKKPRSRQS